MNWSLRLRAAGIHLMSSLIVAAIAASVVFLVWYPWPYRIISGGEDLFLLLISVDIVMGPLITLAIFNIKKPRKELKRDLSIIVVLQLAALGFGLHTVYMARPVVLALEVDRFRVTTAVGVVEAELAKAQEGFRELSLTGPRLVNTATPTEEERYDAIMLGMAGADLGTRPTFWRTWDDSARARVRKAGKPVSQWLSETKVPAATRAAVVDAVARTGKSAEQLLYLPMLARRNDWSVLADSISGDPVGFAPINAN